MKHFAAFFSVLRNIPLPPAFACACHACFPRRQTFSAIMQLTDVQEGIIVRCIQRLDETLRDVKNAARTIGNPTLYEKAGEASTAIKRDIVFAASLYTQA